MSNDEIIRLIGKIRERYDQVQDPSGNIVSIEIDMLRADIRELYEKISLLTQAKPHAAIPQSQITEPEISEEEVPLMAEPVSETEFTSEPASEVFLEQQVAEGSFSLDSTPSSIVTGGKQEIISPVPIFVPISEIETPKEAVPPVLAQTPVQSPASGLNIEMNKQENTAPLHSTLDLFGAPTQTMADKFRGEKRSINEKLNLETTADKSIGSKLRLKITDLRSAIGINDRFIFINELFEGDMRIYDDMLGRLNTCASLQEALEVFNHAKALQEWPDELSSVERLLDFILRRYS